jgi:hypothetical protein
MIKNIRVEEGSITININEVQRKVREYFKNSYTDTLENLEEIINF